MVFWYNIGNSTYVIKNHLLLIKFSKQLSLPLKFSFITYGLKVTAHKTLLLGLMLVDLLLKIDQKTVPMFALNTHLN